MIEAVWDQGFKRSYRKRIQKHPHLKRQFREKIAQFLGDPFDSHLRTHKLSGKLKGTWAFSINDDSINSVKVKKGWSMLQLTWTDTGLEDLAWWVEHNPKVLKRIVKLCLNTCQNPKTGIGKPEPLGFDLQGYWSRRITQEHGRT